MEKIDIINNYLNGKLSPDEIRSLEQAMANNPELKDLLNQETLLKEAISNYRSMELKGQMNAINVSSSGISNYLRLVAGLAIFGGISAVGGYYLWQNKTNDNAKNVSVNRNTEIVKNTESKNTPIIASESIKNTASKTKPEKQGYVKQSEQQNLKNISNQEPQAKEHDIETSGPSDFNSEVEESNVGKQFQNINLSNIEVFEEKTNSKELKYRHSNSKLYLSGNFTKKYIIVAVKADELYLSYNNNFYYIRNNVQTYKPLEKVENKGLCTKLIEKIK